MVITIVIVVFSLSFFSPSSFLLLYREAQAKLAQKRVQNVEKHFGMLCETVGSITRKSARLRDKGL